MKPLRIGVLSHAHGHINTYCQVLRGRDDVELVASWDADPDRGRRAAEAAGTQFRARVQDVTGDPRIDAVFIGSPTHQHAELVEAAAGHGKAILLQKPMATTLADCDRIIAAVETAGVPFSVAYQMRHDPVNAAMKTLLDEGRVGRVAVVRRRHCINVLLNPAFGTGDTAWHVDPEANVGMFFDDAAHAADWFYWMLGPPVSVVAEIDAVVTDRAPDDNGVALYRFAGGVMGILLNSSTTVAAAATTEIYGDAGTILQDYGDAPSTSAPRPAGAVPLRSIRQGEAAWTEYDLPIPAGQGERIAAVPGPFLEYLRGERAAPVTAIEGRVSVEMVLGAYRAAARGQRIVFPLAGDGAEGVSPMIFGWLALIVAVALAGGLLRIYMDFTNRSRRLKAEIDHNRTLVDGHADTLDTTKRRTEEVRREVSDLVRQRGDLESSVIAQREKLTQLEERLERTRPSSHRVDTSKTDDDDFFG